VVNGDIVLTPYDPSDLSKGSMLAAHLNQRGDTVRAAEVNSYFYKQGKGGLNDFDRGLMIL
jgi:hypothetical protein